MYFPVPSAHLAFITAPVTRVAVLHPSPPSVLSGRAE